MKTEFYEVLKELRESSSSEAEKGRRFEDLMVQFFRADPLYSNRFEWVKLWGDWEDRPHSDIGIDIVAQEKNLAADSQEPLLCAIQCKFYAEDAVLQKKDVDSFIAESSKAMWNSRILVHTAESVSSNVEKLIEGQKTPVTVLDDTHFSESRINWPKLLDEPQKLEYVGDIFETRPHQESAIKAVVQAFKGTQTEQRAGVEKGKAYDRGKMVMACGTGKTFTALKIAEEFAGAGGRVLYLVPSISLLQQTMREWAEQKSLTHNYIGICSDKKAGKDDENENIFELEIPVTTNPDSISNALKREKPDAMRVVFCTYQSIDLVRQAQSAGAPEFDIILADEAHRTTGLEKLDTGDDELDSVFVRVHNTDYIKAKKRLYMTATPRVYADALKERAKEKSYGVFSMDDEATYGPTLYELNFSEAVTQQLLSDYKVIIIHVSEEFADKIYSQDHLAKIVDAEKLKLEDAAKIVGSAKALSFPENDKNGKPKPNQAPLKRAIAFCNTIKYSQMMERAFQAVVGSLKEQLEDDAAEEAANETSENEVDENGTDGNEIDANETNGDIATADLLDFEVRHVDGKTNALERRRQIDWLKGRDKSSSRILSNARCLTEGIDVPALDAAMFLSPRNSYVDVIQAVGRVMRRAKGKKFGYIVLPVIIPSNKADDPKKMLDDNKRYQVVWRVLQALRSHDERLDIEINSASFAKGLGDPEDESDAEDENKTGEEPKISNIIVDNDGEVGMPGSQYAQQLNLSLDDKDFLNAIHTKIVERVGDRRYWEYWAEDVADIASTITGRIDGLLKRDEKAQKEFQKFLKDLQKVVSPAIEEKDAVNMLAQHLITAPVFEALFEGYDFASSNPVSKAMTKMAKILQKTGLEAELQDLEKFYESVKRRAQAVTEPEKRQELIKDLYEKFFQTAFKKDADRLGIVYTPVEIVDFILHSADYALRKEFGRGLSDEGVDIIEPFVGTGTFITRLLHSDLIKDKDLERKFRDEIHANELLLLAYYIAAVNIEEAYHFRRPGDDYEPFEGIVLRDTFSAGDGGSEESLLPDYFPINSERAKKQDAKKIQVIVSNPPWSAWQKSAADKNPNVKHIALEKRIENTYVELSTAQQRAGLYDSYIKAIRWATNRIDDNNGGCIAFVTNGGWLDGRAADGMRACLAKDFTSIYCFNLRGNARMSGEAVKKEGEKIFGGGSRATVVITVFIKNLAKQEEGDCKIYYKDIGDYLKREEKLGILKSTISIEGVDDWQLIEPDKSNDWLNQKDPRFETYRFLGNKQTKNEKETSSVFKIYSRGIATSRDAWAYSSSKDDLIEREQGAVEFFNSQLEKELSGSPESNLGIIKWHRESLKYLSQYAKSGKNLEFKQDLVREVMYRPFFKQHCYFEISLNSVHNLMDKIFPLKNSQNLTVNIAGRSAQDFSTIISNFITDLHLEAGGGQLFPRFVYRRLSEFGDSGNGEVSQRGFFDSDGENLARSGNSVQKPDIPQILLQEPRGKTKRGYL